MGRENSRLKRRYVGLLVALILNGETLNGIEQKPHCGIRLVIYRFIAEPGTEIAYAGRKFTVGASGIVELLAEKAQTKYRVGSRERDIAGEADEFGIVTIKVMLNLIAGVPEDLAEIILDAAREYQVDARLLVAVARRESDFRRDAVSPVGARGVMQLMPATAAWLGVRDPFDPRQNIMGGAKYLGMLQEMFEGDLALTLAAYNAGPGNVRKYRGIPPFGETRAYVAAIRQEYESAVN